MYRLSGISIHGYKFLSLWRCTMGYNKVHNKLCSQLLLLNSSYHIVLNLYIPNQLRTRRRLLSHSAYYGDKVFLRWTGSQYVKHSNTFYMTTVACSFPIQYVILFKQGMYSIYAKSKNQAYSFRTANLNVCIPWSYGLPFLVRFDPNAIVHEALPLVEIDTSTVHKSYIELKKYPLVQIDWTIFTSYSIIKF